MKRNKTVAIILATLLLIYPIYSIGAEVVDRSPNLILGSSDSGKLGESGADQEQEFLKKYTIDAPDRKIPLDSDFDLFYGIKVTDKEGNEVENNISITDANEFNDAVTGSYTVQYGVKVGELSASFSRVITVTPYRVEMNDLVIVKESEEDNSSDSNDLEDDKYAELEGLYATENKALYVAENDDELEGDSLHNTEEEYFVAVTDASIFQDPSILDNIKKPETVAAEETGNAEKPASQEVSEELDILSTHPNGQNLEPLDLRYGIKVLNPDNESLEEHLKVVSDDDFSMEEADPQKYDVEYAVIVEDAVIVELHRNVSVLGNTRATSNIISEMVIEQVVVDNNGVSATHKATWKDDGRLDVLVDGLPQYMVGSGTVLKMLNEPLEVTEVTEGGGTFSHQIVGENIHSFVGDYIQKFMDTRNDLAMYSFNDLSGAEVKRRGFIGADDNTKRSPILADGEKELRNKITIQGLVEEFDVVRQEDDTSTMSMTRKYKYYPDRALLNKKTTGQVLNNKPLFELEVRVSFVPGELRLLREITITNLGADYRTASGETPVFQGHLMYMADTRFAGNDFGFTFRDEIDDSVYVRGVADGARTMVLKGHQPSEAFFVGAWTFGAGVAPNGLPDNFLSRYENVYGAAWFEETSTNQAVLSGLGAYTQVSGTPRTIGHTVNPHYNMSVRTVLEGELPKNLKSMAYPVTKTLFATDILGSGAAGANFINGSIDTSYAMQWPLPPTAVGESYTFVVEESWLAAADIYISAPMDESISAGESKTLRFTAENTHMFDHAAPGAQVWDLDTNFTLVSEGVGGVSSWPATIEKVYKNVNGTLVEVPFTGGTLKVNAGEKLYFDIKITVDRKALGGHQNKLTLKASSTNGVGYTSESYDSMVITADSLAVITSVSAQDVGSNKVTAKVAFNNPALIDPQDPTVVYNTTVKLYDSNNLYITEVTGKIASGGTLSFTGLTLVEGETYKLVATAEPEATGSAETTFLFSSEEGTITYTQDPSYAIITGMPSPLTVTTMYSGGKADFILASSPPTAVGLIFEGWEDVETTLVYPAGSTFSMLLTEVRREATLKTTWKVDPNYKIGVTFDVNGGTGTIPNQIKYVGDKIVLPVETIVKTGYKLSGWTTVKDVSTTKWDFNTILTGVPQTITLYAYWEDDPASWAVSIVEAPEFLFGTKMISSTSQVVPLETTKSIKIRDTYPGTISNWTLSVSASQFKTAGNKTLHKEALQYFDAAGVGKSVYYNGALGEGSPINIWTEANSSTQFDYQRDFDSTMKESFGVALLPSEGTLDKYSAVVTWRLTIAP